MKPQGDLTPGGQSREETVTTTDLEQLANPLSVVHGYTQLLQRRLRAGKTMDDDELFRVLNLIEVAARQAAARLAVLAQRTHARVENGESPVEDGR